jgi:signal transduction histidine kinase
MINDLLELSRLDAKQLALAKEPVDVGALVRAGVARAALTGGARPFEVRCPEALPPVSADPDRVAQVLDNLLSNALKYGAAGTPITVNVEARQDEVAVSVTNSGSGIAPEELPRLFRRFHRTDEARRSGVKGIGLGLYITRELVEAHGGRIDAESEPGRLARPTATTEGGRSCPRDADTLRTDLPVAAGANALRSARR